MNVLLISIDSLRRDMLGAYRDQPRGFDYTVETPHLDRFAERATVFDTHYVGSQFCMPTRREWLAGIKEFLWRPWGPIEPFDRTLPQLARENGALTKLITDHYHYFQHGADGYYHDFHGFDFVRGHEHDAWRTTPRTPDPEFLQQIGAADPDSLPVLNTDHPHSLRYMNRAQYARNVASFDSQEEMDFFAPQVFSKAADWLEANRSWDQWFCYVDSFDVHEPFHLPEPYASMYTDEDPQDPDLSVWPHWGRTDEGRSEITDRELAFVRSQFAGTVTMVDRWFGHLLEALDAGDYWEDTVVIVTSDHGFSLGDHGWLGKLDTPLYDEIAHTPLFVHHPAGDVNRVSGLTTAIDLYPTMLEVLDAPVPAHTHGQSLVPTLRNGTAPSRTSVLYGLWGGGICVTDGRYTYHHPCDTSELAYCYSTTQMNARGQFNPLRPKPGAEAGGFLPYSDAPVWRFEASSFNRNSDPLLFDTVEDPGQETNLAPDRPEIVDRFRETLRQALSAYAVPHHQFTRLNLETPGSSA